MESLRILLIASFVLTACTRAPTGPEPVCFPKRPSDKKLMAPEKKALAQSQQRVAKRCASTDTQCGYSVRTQPDGTIAVGVTFAVLDGEPRKCVWIIGDHHIDLYTKGHLARTLPGM